MYATPSILGTWSFRSGARTGTVLDGLFSGEVIGSQGRQYLLTVMIDITRRKKAEADLQKERMRLDSILQGTNVGTWEWNVQTGETVFNERWADIIGYTLDELAPVSIETWIRHIHPEDLTESDKLLKEHFRGERPHYELEYRMQHKNGHWGWGDGSGQCGQLGCRRQAPDDVRHTSKHH